MRVPPVRPRASPGAAPQIDQLERTTPCDWSSTPHPFAVGIASKTAPLRRVCGRLVFRFGRGFTHGSAGARSTFTTSEGNVVEFVYYDSTVTRTRETTSTTSRFVDHGPPPDARVLDDPRVQGHHQLCELRCGAEGARARTRRSSPAAALLGSPEAAPRRRPSLAGHGGEPKAPAESRK